MRYAIACGLAVILSGTALSGDDGKQNEGWRPPGVNQPVAEPGREAKLEYKAGAPGSPDGDKCYVTNFGKQTIIVTVRSKRDGENPSVTEYTLLPGASEFVGHKGIRVTTQFDITAARYK